MFFEWFAFQKPLLPTVAHSVTGIAITLIFATLAVFVFIRHISSFKSAVSKRPLLFAILILAAPFLAETAVLHVQATSLSEMPIALLGFLPLLVGALTLGTAPAMLIGILTGLSWVLFSGVHTTQPFEIGLMAAMLTWLIRQPYRGSIARLLRQPIVSILLSALFVGWPLGLLGIFAGGGSSEVASLEQALNAFWPLLASLLICSTVAGILVELLLLWRPDWQAVREDDLILPPWEQHLGQRMLYTLVPLLALAIIALVGLLAITAYQVATGLVLDQMSRDATNASESIPFFVQVGRGLIRNLAQDPTLAEAKENVSAASLAQGLRSVPFFQQLVYFNANGEKVTSYPEADLLPPNLLQEESTRIRIAVTGTVPGEIVLGPAEPDSDIVMSFISPVLDSNTGQSRGALVGRTVLSANPVLSPVVEILRSGFVGSGVGFITDEQNKILLYPAQPQLQQTIFTLNAASEIPQTGEGRAFRQQEPDGTRDLIYMLPVAGRSDWNVVVTIPNEVVLGLATRIALPMLLLLALLTAIAIPLMITVTRQITEPLDKLLAGVDAISEGDLGRPVEVNGQDEIGRLGVAFEQMRIHLKDRLDEQERLLRISRSVSSSLELFRAMPPILSSALEVSNAIAVRIVVRRGESEPLQSYAAGEAAAVIAPLDEQVMSLTEQQGTIVISQLWRASTSLNITALPPRIQAIVALPLRSDTTFHGILWLAYDHEHVFEQSEMTFLSTLAGQTAVAISNAKLFTEAEEERHKLEAVLESTPDAMIVADQQGRIILLNPAAERYLGVRADNVRWKPVQEVIDLPELANLLTDLQEPISVLEFPGQRGKVLLGNVSTMVTQDGAITGRVAVMRDITALKELDNIKTVFLRMVSHDLRSPLTYMRGYLSMLSLIGDLNDRQKEAIDKVTSGIDSISDMTERLLYLSRLQFGDEAELELSLVDVEALVNDIAAQQEQYASQRDVKLRLEMEEKLPLIAADEMLYRQAIANLMTNALKYTPEGGEVIVRAFENGDDGDTQITITVADTGIGIREEDQPRLFEAFFRVPQREGEPARPRGTGLGLALVKAIATAHGGQVAVESEFGHGSTFRITLPVRRVEDL